MKRAFYFILSSIAFLGAFAVTCVAIHRALPVPPVPAVQAKLLHLEQNAQAYDTFFIGSSRIYHQIDPEKFDRLMAGRGNPTRSFNAGIDGVRPPEDAYILDQILDRKPPKLRYVFIELGSLRIPLDEEKRGTIRSVYWHDLRRMEILFVAAISQKFQKTWLNTLKEFQDPFAAFFEHVELFARNLTNIGRGEALTHYLKKYDAPYIAWAALGEKRDGFTIVTRAGELPAHLRTTYESAMRKREKEPAKIDFADDVSQVSLEKMVGRVRAAGAIPVLIVPPTTGKKKFLPKADIAAQAVVFDYCDLVKYPGLFEISNRQDTSHLNEPGAALFTEILVNEFSAAIGPVK